MAKEVDSHLDSLFIIYAESYTGSGNPGYNDSIRNACKGICYMVLENMPPLHVIKLSWPNSV